MQVKGRSWNLKTSRLFFSWILHETTDTELLHHIYDLLGWIVRLTFSLGRELSSLLLLLAPSSRSLSGNMVLLFLYAMGCENLFVYALPCPFFTAPASARIDSAEDLEREGFNSSTRT